MGCEKCKGCAGCGAAPFETFAHLRTLSHQLQDLPLADGAEIAAEPPIEPVEGLIFHAQAVAAAQVGEEHPQIRRLIGAGISICLRDVDVAQRDERATLAAATGAWADAAECDHRTGNDRARRL